MMGTDITSRLYFECHVTIEPVYDDELTADGKSRMDELKSICKNYKFQVAELLMQKRSTDTQVRSKDDTFCTGRGKSYNDLKDRMASLIQHLTLDGYEVWRYKIEDTLLDSKSEGDVLGVMRYTQNKVGSVQ